VLILDVRYKLSGRGELFVNASLANTEAFFNRLTLVPFADVPIDLIDPDDAPGELPGPGPDDGSALRFHDYDFSEVNTYSDLEYSELRTTIGINYDLNDTVGLFASYSYYDVDDKRPYLQDATGSVDLVAGGLTWSF
jgi:hypothetical protein